jgi:hypothetical protein
VSTVGHDPGENNQENIMSAQVTGGDCGVSSNVRSVEEGNVADRRFDCLAPVIFGLFMTSLIALLVLTYVGVPLV